MPTELYQLVDKLFSLDALKLALIVILVSTATPILIHYFKERQERRQQLRENTSREALDLVKMLVEHNAPFPEHWSKYVDQRIKSRFTSLLSAPLATLSNLEQDVSELQRESRRQTRQLDRLVGRFLPQEPLDPPE